MVRLTWRPSRRPPLVGVETWGQRSLGRSRADKRRDPSRPGTGFGIGCVFASPPAGPDGSEPSAAGAAPGGCELAAGLLQLLSCSAPGDLGPTWPPASVPPALPLTCDGAGVPEWAAAPGLPARGVLKACEKRAAGFQMGSRVGHQAGVRGGMRKMQGCLIPNLRETPLGHVADLSANMFHRE